MQLDLNLLTALDALLEEGSVGAAAERLHLSQPAMSRTLNRIRRTTGDPILVRSGRTMLPTPYALAVRADVHTVVQQARRVLAPQREVDLATLERTFVLRCHDAITTALAPDLVAAVRAEAPGVRLRFLAESSADSDDLRRGHTDVEIGAGEPATTDLRAEHLGQEEFRIVMRRANPLCDGELTVDRYAAAEHITISRRGRLRDPVDTALEELGMTRHVVASAPTTAVGLRIVATSDIIVAVPAAMCRPDITTLDLTTAPLPVDTPPVQLVLTWHRRYDTDNAHTWLRHHMRTTLTANRLSRY
jgi:DNA-binding transcriptional LysR family regulator